MSEKGWTPLATGRALRESSALGEDEIHCRQSGQNESDPQTPNHHPLSYLASFGCTRDCASIQLISARGKGKSRAGEEAWAGITTLHLWVIASQPVSTSWR